MLIPLDGSGPLYVQVYRAIREAIHEDRLRPGDRLPATRELADRLDVSRTVALEAYRQLRAEGYVEARVGSGTYVAEVETDRLARPGLETADDAGSTGTARPDWSSLVDRLPEPDIPFPPTEDRREDVVDFRVGRLSEEDFPARAWGRLLARHGRRTPPDYGDHRGDPGLRAQIAAYLERSRGVASDPEHVVVTAGARQAFDLLGRLLLEEGDAVVVEEPCYSEARACFTATGARAIPVPVDARGLVVDRLPRRDDVGLAYVTPSHQFPTGGVLPVGRRTELLQWAEERDVFVVEDDYDSEFQFDVRPVPALKALDRSGRVLYVGTFAKVLSPDLRLGYVVLPGPVLGPFLALKRMSDRQCPIFLQRALAEFMEEDGFDRHLRRSRKRHGERRRALVEAVERELDRAEISGSEAGLHVLLRLPELGPDRGAELARRAAEAGVLLFTADEHYMQQPECVELLVGYAALEEEAIEEGVRRLAAVVEAVSAEPRPRS